MGAVSGHGTLGTIGGIIAGGGSELYSIQVHCTVQSKEMRRWLRRRSALRSMHPAG